MEPSTHMGRHLVWLQAEAETPTGPNRRARIEQRYQELTGLAAEVRRENRRAYGLRRQTNIESMVEEVLKAVGIEYKREHRFGVYRADFWLPAHATVIECDGDYWHSKPEVRAKDARKDKHLVAQGVRVIRLGDKQCRRLTPARLTQRLGRAHAIT